MNKTKLSKELISLKPWSNFNGLENLSGINTIEVKLATPLNNSILMLTPNRQQQENGLMRPVKMVPLKEEVIDLKKPLGNNMKENVLL